MKRKKEIKNYHIKQLVGLKLQTEEKGRREGRERNEGRGIGEEERRESKREGRGRRKENSH